LLHIPWRFILVLSFPGTLLPSGFPTKTRHEFFFSYVPHGSLILSYKRQYYRHLMFSCSFFFLGRGGCEKCVLNLSKKWKLEASVYKVLDVIQMKVLTCNIAIVKLRKIRWPGPLEKSRGWWLHAQFWCRNLLVKSIL
jgi:hypothetical protein